MVPHLAVTDADLAVLVRSPDDNLVGLVDDSDESAANVDTPNAYIVVQFDFAGSFELTEDARTPYVHDTLLSDSCACMPR